MCSNLITVRLLSGLPVDIAKILGPGEQVQLYIQQKIYHPKISIDSVLLTNQRLILRHPHALNLKKDFTDYSYTDIANAILDKGVLRSTVRCQLRFGGDPLNLNDLPNSDAERAYGIIRSNIARYQTPFSTGYPQPVQVMQAPVQAIGARCPKCGQTNNQGAKFCGTCGSQL